MNKCPICFTVGKYHRKDCPNGAVLIPEHSYKKLVPIKSKEEYEDIKKRVAVLEKEIGDNWFDKQIVKDKEGKDVEETILNKKNKDKIEEHGELANRMLEYEIDNDLIKI